MSRFLLAVLFLLSACVCLPALPAASPAPAFNVITHPDGPLYASDKISFEVLPPAGLDPSGKTIQISQAEQILDEQPIQPWGLGKRNQATFYWVWDTAGLAPGPHTLTFTLLPDHQSWQETYSLLPAAALPYPEPQAHWAETPTSCCILHYVTGTAAERDITTLADMANSQAASVEQNFGAKFQQQIPLTFLPRTLGHGGFTSDGLYVSYLDQNYAGSTTAQVIHHEMIHWLDAQQGGDLRPTLLAEGLAVYLSGGHFKEEPIFPRAAALLDLGWYIPLRQLTNTFYTSQHETGYLEAAALVGYLIQTHGWQQFDAFYRDIHPAPDNLPSTALDTALQAHFSLDLAALETDFLTFLRAQPVTADQRTDLRLTIAFYDTLRRYQQAHDPSAYFLTAWLPPGSHIRQKGLLADWLRHPRNPINQQVEALLVASDARLRAGYYSQAENLLRAVRLLLDLESRPAQ